MYSKGHWINTFGVKLSYASFEKGTVFFLFKAQAQTRKNIFQLNQAYIRIYIHMLFFASSVCTKWLGLTGTYHLNVYELCDTRLPLYGTLVDFSCSLIRIYGASWVQL